MPDRVTCPDVSLLKKLATADLPPDELEPLLQHLHECDTCLSRLPEHSTTDTLVEAINRAKALAQKPDDPNLSLLIERLAQLGRAAAKPLMLTCDCGKNLKVKAELAGKKVKCPGCGKTIQVPAAAPGASVSKVAEDRTLPPRSRDAAEDKTLPPKGGDTKSGLSGAAHKMGTRSGEKTQPAAGDEEEAPLDFLAPAQQPDELGRLGKYRLLKKLGAGGMGMVFLAEDTLLHRKVAMKLMLPQFAASAPARERFLREARAAASIEHEHIVAIHEVGEENKVPFLVMPFLKGMPLDAFLDKEGKLAVPEALRIAAEMAEGLAAAHANGLIHRDIKPGNVWLETKGASAGRVKLLDFGLARSEDDTRLTQSGALVGTPAFMAPEQARGNKVDSRADLFSLGCVLYLMLTGERPFKGNDTISLLSALALDTPASPREVNSDVPRAVSDLTMRLLEKNPDKRPASAADAARELVQAGRGDKETMFSTARPPAAAGASARRRPLFKAAMLLAGIIGVAAMALTVIIVRTEQGDYVIETDDPDIFFQVGKDGSVTVEDRQKKRKFNISKVESQKKGEFTLEVNEVASGLTFNAQQFMIKRGQQVAFKALFLPKQIETKPPSAADDKEQKQGPGLRELAGVQNLQGLESLDLHGNKQVTDARLSGLAELGNLRLLDLSGTNVTDAGLKELAGLKRLRKLLLNKSKVTDAGLKELAPCRNLQTLGLEDTKVTDAGLKHLAGIERMEVLYLGGTQVTDAGLKELARHKSLAWLELQFTNVTDMGLKDLAGFKSLRTLHLRGTRVSDAGLNELAGLTDLQELGLRETEVTDAGLKRLAPCKNLQALNLEDTKVTDTGLKHLAGMKRMEVLYLGSTQVTGAGLKELNGLKSLRWLELQYTKVTDASLKELALFKSLRTLHLRGTQVSNAGLKELAGLTNLQELGLKETKVTAAGVADLQKALPACSIIGLANIGTAPPKDYINKLGMKFTWIAPGGFTMGSPPEEIGRETGETQHKVTLTRGFYMSVHLVTQEQWQAVMGNNPSNFKGEKNLPVDSVSWLDCQKFMKKLREKDNRPYRLPTEAEWEYACRAGTATPYWCGETISTEQANYWGGKHGNKTTPVDTFPPNPWGLYDMHGNVFQWCQDWSADYPQSDAVDPQGPEKGILRVLRGGSFNFGHHYCRSASRIGRGLDDRSFFGVRVCVFLESKDPQPKDIPKYFTNDIGVKFVWIPPGSFTMGSPQTEFRRRANESQHRVKLTKGFYMGVHLVTQQQWQAVMGYHAGNFKGEKDLPAEAVSWNACQEFVKQLRAKDGKAYRLPTEAEWEYACRAGTTTAYYFGPTINVNQANYGKHYKKPTPVDFFPPNPWGLHDMHGNVFQWCQDWHGDYPQGDAVDPKGPEKSWGRVARGGYWLIGNEGCRSASRDANTPVGGHYGCGFRVCFSVEEDAVLALKKDPPENKLAPELSNPDRSAAEWVVSVGGKVTIAVGSKRQDFTKKATLPDREFRLVAIDLFGNEKVANADLQRFAGLTNLESLVLRGTKITGNGVVHLADLKNLEYLDLAGTIVNDSDLEHLKGLRNLRVIKLTWTPITGTGFRYLKGHVNLTDVVIPSPNITDELLFHLASIPNVRVLDIRGPQITDTGLSHLKKCANLENLVMDGPNITDAGLAHLKTLSKLSVLSLHGPNFTNTGLAHLNELPKLSFLSLGEKTKITDVGLAQLRGLTGLSLSIPDLKYLHKLPMINQLNLFARGATDADLDQLSGLTNLTYIDLRANPVSESAVKKLSGKMPQCRIDWAGGVIPARTTIPPKKDKAADSPSPSKLPRPDASLLDKLDPDLIPPDERFPWQPKELVGVLGSQRARTCEPHRCLSFSPDGKTIADAHDHVWLFDPLTLKENGLLWCDERAHMGFVIYSSDGKTLATRADAPEGI